MNKKNAIILHLVILSALFTFSGCSNATKGTSKVTINLNLDRSIKSGAGNSWTDKIGGIINPNPQPRGSAPSNLTSISLKVSGSDMEDMAVTYNTDIPSSIDVEVPSGNQRKFTVSAISDTYYYTGTAAADLAANVDTALDITMATQYTDVIINPSFTGGTSYSITVSATGSGVTTTLLSAQTFTLGSAVKIPTGTNRDIIVTATTPDGNYTGILSKQEITAVSMTLDVTMTSNFANVAVTPTNPLGMPANILSYSVKVTSSSTTVLPSQTFTPGVSFAVPAGSANDFEILIATQDTTLRGTLTGQSLTEGATVNLDIPVSLYRTKIIIPDIWNIRVVQIDDMTGGGWAVFDFNNVPTWTFDEFIPRAVDYDSIGRIYIANSYSLPGRDVIIRADSIIGGNVTPLAGGNGLGYNVIAIDRTNNIIYKAASDNTLSKCDIDGNNDTPLTSTDFSYISGLAVDSTGVLYITYQSSIDYYYYIGIYDPSLGSITTSYQIISGTPMDILSKTPYVYIANDYGGDNNLILRFDSGLTTMDGYGTAYVSTEGPMIFRGPGRFAAKLNDAFTVMDGDCSHSSLSATDDLTGTGWVSYGSIGSLPGQFNFYNGGCK